MVDVLLEAMDVVASHRSLPKRNLNKPTVPLIDLIKLNDFTDDEEELTFPNYKYKEIYYLQEVFKNFKRKTLFLIYTNV